MVPNRGKSFPSEEEGATAIKCSATSVRMLLQHFRKFLPFHFSLLQMVAGERLFHEWMGASGVEENILPGTVLVKLQIRCKRRTKKWGSARKPGTEGMGSAKTLRTRSLWYSANRFSKSLNRLRDSISHNSKVLLSTWMV